MAGLQDFVSGLIEAYPALRLDLLARLFLAVILGGAVGYERGAHGKPAGLRTNILICVGAALLTDLSRSMAGLYGDPARISAQIVSGVGFLGAGTIIQARGGVTGLTTAATLWVVAAIGIAVGAGAYVEAAGTTLLVLIALAPLRSLELRAERHRHLVEERRNGPPDSDAGGADDAAEARHPLL